MIPPQVFRVASEVAEVGFGSTEAMAEITTVSIAEVVANLEGCLEVAGHDVVSRRRRFGRHHLTTVIADVGTALITVVVAVARPVTPSVVIAVAVVVTPLAGRGTSEDDEKNDQAPHGHLLEKCRAKFFI